MPNRLKPLNLLDFTGGVNLRPETFQLAENELPVLLNLEVDPRGGINTRKSWRYSNPNPVVSPGADGFLTPGPVGPGVRSIGPPPVPMQFVITVKVRGPATNSGCLCAQWEGTGQFSWYLRRTTNGSLSMITSTDGAQAVAQYTVIGDAVDSFQPELLAYSMDRTTGTVRALHSTDDGETWVQDDIRTFGAPINLFDASIGYLRVGSREPSGADAWDDRVYSVEMRTGTDPASGSILWRFDANEYTSGTAFTDPRGRLWQLSADGIITAPVAAGNWDPRNAYTHRAADDSQWTYVANDGLLFAAGPAGTWSQIATTCEATPHDADFASWNDLVYVVRGPQQSLYANGDAVTLLTASGTSNWQNDYSAPGATDTFPQAQLIAQHMGYMFVAGTREDAVNYPNRIRWSHPNNPRRWAQTDYIDVTEGGQRITAIIPFSDRLVIFKPDSIWALYGYSAETWEVANISRTVGCWSQQTVCRSEDNVFFLSWPNGIFAYSGTQVNELSVQIRTVFQDHKMDPSSIDNSWLGWVGRRLWCSLPYNDIPPPDDAAVAFVWDPVLNSWTTFVGADMCVPGPYIERIETDTEDSQVTFVRSWPYTVALNTESGVATDECRPGHVHEFQTRMRTRWLDAGAPTWRKSWRRPDFLLRGLTFDTNVSVRVFHDFDAYNAQRSFLVTYSPDNDVAMYTADGDPANGGFYWGDGTLYGGSAQTSSVERGSTMGRAGVVQLQLEGDPGVQWGLNGIIFKYVPRRFR